MSVLTHKKSIIPSVHSSDIVNFRVVIRLATPIFEQAQPKNFKHLLTCMNLYQYAKNRLIPSVHSLDTVNFRAQRPDWPHPFFIMPSQKNSGQI